MYSASQTAAIPSAPPPMVVEVSALAHQRLGELGRLLDIGFLELERMNMAAQTLATSALVPPDQAFRLQVRNVDCCNRIVRSIRQIMVLEFELLGLFEAPDRDDAKRRMLKRDLSGRLGPRDVEIDLPDPVEPTDLRDVRPDYRKGPMADVVASIRRVLGAEAPPNDPFAPDADLRLETPKPAAPKPREAAPPSKPAPASVKLSEKPPVNRAFEAAVLALSAELGGGSRGPSAKPERHANPARPPKSRRNRGPPQ
jgi:hypothetical protein